MGQLLRSPVPRWSVLSVSCHDQNVAACVNFGSMRDGWLASMLIRCLATLTEPAGKHWTTIRPQAPGGDFDEHLSNSVRSQDSGGAALLHWKCTLYDEWGSAVFGSKSSETTSQ